jgi:hypothetical protein
MPEGIKVILVLQTSLPAAVASLASSLQITVLDGVKPTTPNATQ